MLEKGTQMENKKEIILAVLFIFVLAGVAAGYFLWQESKDTQPIAFVPAQYSNATSDVVKNFSQTTQPQQPVLGDSNQQESQAVATPPEKPEAPVAPDAPYDLQLPAGWRKTSKTATSCIEDSEAKTDTYVKGSQTIIVYENGHPGGCNLKGSADVYLDYNFTETAEGITINTSKIAQCSKEQDPDCPKGDGKVSVYIGNKETDTAKQLVANATTQKTYFFSITDTSIQPNFESQVKSLAALVSKITFK